MVEWSKAVDLISTIERCVSSNLTACNTKVEVHCKNIVFVSDEGIGKA